ncbi:MAG: fused MFS/spermidine synthase [Acidimicrobiales bacterium]|nr:fused MFS/spermidine synthase [Acidimicrobiales bacterium]
MRSWSANALVFGTSAAVLVLEIVAGRLLAPYVGISLETFTAIIGTVLAGIALGAALGGRLADHRDPHPLIAAALVIGGGLTWLSLPIVTALGPRLGEDPPAIVALTTAAFLAPAAVLSAISPMVAKLRLESLDTSGAVVGSLSAAGTAGALAGTFLTGFVLVATLPTRAIVMGAGAVLVAAGVIVWFRRGRGGSVGPALLFVAVTGSLGMSSRPPCDHETRYFCVSIVDDEDGAGRSLYLDDLRHAYIDLDDPTHLDIRYIRLFAQVSEALPHGPVDALHIGGGGFTFPRYLADVRAGSEQLVLEIDPELVHIVERELGLVLDEDLRVRVGDARLAVDDLATDAYDLVIGDAFGSASVPWHLTTAEFVEEIHRVLRPDGLYVMNVIDGGHSRFARAELATLAHEFNHVAVILPAEGVPRNRPVNQVLLASDAPLDAFSPAPDDGVLVSGDDAVRYIDGARRLTDDFAPVDQLMMPT